MPTFSYKGLNSQGQMIHGTYVATHVDLVRNMLQSQNIIPLKIKETRSKKISLKRVFEKQDLCFLFHYLHQMMHAGLTLPDALESFLAYAPKNKLNFCMRDVLSEIQSGGNLYTSLMKRRTLFPAIIFPLLSNAHTQGTLTQTCAHIEKHLKWHMDMEKKTKSAFAYPIFLLIFSFLLMGAVIFWFAPHLLDLLNSMGIKSHNMSLRAILWLSRHTDFLIYGILTLLCFGLLISTGPVKSRFSSFLGYHTFLKGIYLEQIATLLESGLPLQTCLLELKEEYAHTQNNQLIQEIGVGKTLISGLSETKFLAPPLIHLLELGEKSTDLPSALRLVASFLTESYYLAIEKLIFWTQPVLLLMIGLIFIGILHATLFPLYESFSLLHF